MAPPTVANGRVYLASFGDENVGTGQFCVYGLLPAEVETKLPAATGAQAQVARGKVTLAWNAVPGAMFYRVTRTSSLDPGSKTAATGLTTPIFTEPSPERGESVAYTIVAVGRDGPGIPSNPVKLVPAKAVPVEQ
jgi:hypothetical protein